jgi:hypothetical protein
MFKFLREMVPLAGGTAPLSVLYWVVLATLWVPGV